MLVAQTDRLVAVEQITHRVVASVDTAPSGTSATTASQRTNPLHLAGTQHSNGGEPADTPDQFVPEPFGTTE